MKVVCLHNIIPETPDPFDRKCSRISESQFKLFLEKVEQKFTLVGVRALLEKSFEEDSVLLTFDDGFQGVFQRALPILKKKNLSAISFINPHHLRDHSQRLIFDFLKIEGLFRQSRATHLELDQNVYELSSAKARVTAMKAAKSIFKTKPSNHRANFITHLADRLQLKLHELNQFSFEDPRTQTMSLFEVQELANAGWWIGGHSLRHFELSALTHSEVQAEVKQSADWLKSTLRTQPIAFAYPSGGPSHFDSESISVLEESPFEMAFSSINGELHAQSPKYSLPRYDLKEFSRKYLEGFSI